MATLALGLAGYALGSWAAAGTAYVTAAATIGQFIGAVAGSLIDAQIFATKPPNIQGPRIEDLKNSFSTYGGAISIAYGQSVRAGGNFIWATDLIETPQVTKVKSGKGGMFGGKKQTITNYTYSMSFALAFCEGPIVKIRKIWGDGKLWYDDSKTPKQNLADDVRVYLGTESQTPDALIVANKGADSTPAYRGIAYIVVENLQLANFANRVPRIEIEWEPGGHTVAGAIAAMAGRVGVQNIDVASITQTLPGFVVARQTTARSAIEELMTAYSLVGASIPGGVTVKPRGVAGGGGIDIEMFGTGSERPAQGQPWRMSRIPQTDIPREVNLAFMDTSRDYQPSAVRAQRQDGTGEGSSSYSLAVVLDPDKAKAMVEQIHADILSSRNTVEGLTLPPSFSQINAGDAFDVKIDGEWRRISLSKASVGSNSLVEISGMEEFAGTWMPHTAITEKPPVPVQNIPEVVATTLHLMDIPILSSLDDDPGFYYAVGGDDGWRSASILRSTDNVNFSDLTYQNIAATMGTCQNTLGNGPWQFFDEVNTLDVLLLADEDELFSCTESDLYSAKNFALVGNELIQFKTATLIAPKTYRLSTLVRGRQGTDHLTGTHGASERFVYIGDVTTIDRVTDDLALRNAVRYYKGVSLYQDATAVTSQSFANTCVGLKPFSPINIVATRDGPGEITFSWTRRTRIPSTLTDGVDAPLGEAFEAYEVDIYDGPDVVRTLTTNTQTAVYSVANQTTDFGSTQSSVTVRVYQISATVGRGQYRQATV